MNKEWAGLHAGSVALLQSTVSSWQLGVCQPMSACACLQGYGPVVVESDAAHGPWMGKGHGRVRGSRQQTVAYSFLLSCTQLA